MKRLIAFTLLSFVSSICFAKNIVVKNIDELNAANKSVAPGDVVILQNGVWNNVVMKLNCSGTENHPIVFKAETPGKVFISGISSLMLGGDYITVDGLYFVNGSSPSMAVIDYRINNKQLANHCRVTNCVINDFNKPKRMDEDNWVSFSGKNNRLDHCSFFNKKNLGVLLAVILDDDRSRENFHSIDHNYFGVRPPLGSNGGEMIRVGVSQHCQFNSNTQIKDNFFEHCDGETEIVSIKSCSNIVSGNVFKECQGSVVLRHGNDNTVTNNLFLGNGKEGTGGVRIINRGQWVINNLFYKCRGVTFRSPMAIMNGIPNSPANRYVQVTDAVVMNNTWVDCTPISFCEGSDAERTLPPSNVLFAKNIFYNHSDSNIYRTYDNVSGFRFASNEVSPQVKQDFFKGFQKDVIASANAGNVNIPVSSKNVGRPWIDSLKAINSKRLPDISSTAGFSGSHLVEQLQQNAKNNCGAKWFKETRSGTRSAKVSCSNAHEILLALANEDVDMLTIELTGSNYAFGEALAISKNVSLTTANKNEITFTSEGRKNLENLFEIKGGASLTISHINLDLAGVKADDFVTTDKNGSSDHSGFYMKNCTVKNFSGPGNHFFHSVKSTFCDSISITGNLFQNNDCCLFSFTDETDKKGYYSVEKLTISNNTIKDQKGSVLQMLRGGNDESTLGPKLLFSNNMVSHCTANKNEDAMINLYGIQQTKLENNSFINCFKNKDLVLYEDVVRAVHIIRNNKMEESGNIAKDQFVTD